MFQIPKCKGQILGLQRQQAAIQLHHSNSDGICTLHFSEQAKRKDSVMKNDIYSLGITMYEMVTGHVPFDHENGVTIALMHLQNEITLPSRAMESRQFRKDHSKMYNEKARRTLSDSR